MQWLFIILSIFTSVFMSVLSRASVGKTTGRLSESNAGVGDKKAEEHLSRSTEVLAAFHSTLLEISAPYELPALLQAILERAVQLLNANSGRLFLADHQKQELRCVTIYNSSGTEVGDILKFGEGAAGQVAESKTPLIINQYPSWTGNVRLYTRSLRITALVSVPMLWQGQVIGVINVAETENKRKFTQDDVELLTIFANQSAILMESGRLIQSERKQREAAETLREVTSALTSCLNREEVLRLILDQLARVVEYDSASVMLVTGNKFEIVASRGFSLQERKSLAVGSLKHLQEVIRTRRPLIIPDTRNDPRWIELPQKTTIRSWLGIPLVFQQQVIGILNLDKDQPGFYHEDDFGMALAFANQAAIAIENARMYETEQQRASLIETLLKISETVGSTLDFHQIFAEIVLAARNLLPVDRVVIFLWDEEGGRLYPTLPHPDSPIRVILSPQQYQQFSRLSFSIHEIPLVKQLKENNQPIVITSAARSELLPRKWMRYFSVGSMLAVPFNIQGQFLGALYMDSISDHRRFSTAEIDLAVALARQTALAIERARLFEAAQTRARGAETLRLATAAVTASLCQEEAIEKILEQLAHVVPYDSASIQLLQEGYLEIVGGRGWKDLKAILGMRFPIPGDNPNTQVILKRKSKIVNDTSNCYKTFQDENHKQIRSWLGVPLVVQERVIGMLAIDSFTEGYFTKDHVRFASTFADQVAIAIENARLYDEVEQRANELSYLYMAAQDLGASLEPRVVLEKMVRIITEAIDGTSGYIREIGEREDSPQAVLASYYTPMASQSEREMAGRKAISLNQYPEAVNALQKGEAISFNPGTAGLSDKDRIALENNGIKACLVVPLTFQGKFLGEVEVWETNRAREFSAREKNMVQALAQHAAGTIENARLYTNERQRARELDALRATIADITSELELPNLLRDILERAVTLMNATGGDLGIYNESDQNLLIVTSFNLGKDYTGTCQELGEGLMGQAALQRESLILQDYQNWEGRSPQYHEGLWKAAIAVPLEMGGKLLGTVGVVDADPNRQFTVSDQHLLTLFAQQAAIAIHNARLYLTTKEAADRRAILHRASQEIVAASLDEQSIYKAIHNAASLLMPSEAFVISLLDDSNQVIKAVYLMDRSGSTPPFSLPIKAGLSGHVISTGQSIYIEDLENYDEVESIRFGDSEDVRSILAVPMILRGKVIGMISTQNYQARAYTSEDMYLLEMLAAHAAIAIDNTHLFQEVQMLATTDSLTGVNNRRKLYELAEREYSRALRYGHPLAAIMVDIDKFKKVNDTYGHNVGDQVLITFIQRIREKIRDIDILGRYGGDEFVIMLPETDLNSACQVAERLRAAISDTPFETDSEPVTLTVSLGVSVSEGTSSLDVLIDRADVAVYIAKEAGRNRVGVA
jgi:diguanylate cyclase (GGDEF)-like protein